MKPELVFTVVIFGFAGYKIVSYLFDKFGSKDRYDEASSGNTQSDFRGQTDAASSASSDQAWWVVLGVRPDSSTIEIRAAHRSLMSKYHPDKVESLGDEFKEIARTKSQEINSAYEKARLERSL